MTTIAWDSKEMAADSQLTQNGLVTHTVKIWKGSNFILAVCGAIDEGYAFKAVLEGEMKEKNAAISKDFAAMVWWDSGEIEEYYNTMVPVPVYGKYNAMGSGAPVALAAMHAGKSAREAVELAKKLDAYTGGKVVSYSWDKVKKGKKKKNEPVPTDHLQVEVREVSGGGEPSGRVGGNRKTVY